MRRALPLLFLSITILAVSCKSQYELMLDSSDVPAKYKMAFELFEKGKYSKAASMFESLKLAVRGTPQDDTVQFYTAFSYYRFNDPMTAEQSFNSFITTFPRSPFIDKARFMYLDCLYKQTYRYELDQMPSRKAIDAINAFIVDFPSNEHIPQCEAMRADLEERIDRKDYEAAKLYYNIEDFKAAHYTLKLLLKEDPNNIYREDIMYYTVMSAYEYAFNSVRVKQKERYMIFIDEYFTFLSEYPESEYRRHLDPLAKRIQNYLEKENLPEYKMTTKEKK